MPFKHCKNLDVFNLDLVDNSIGFEEHFPNILALKFRDLSTTSGIASGLVNSLLQLPSPLSSGGPVFFGYKTTYLK